MAEEGKMVGWSKGVGPSANRLEEKVRSSVFRRFYLSFPSLSSLMNNGSPSSSVSASTRVKSSASPWSKSQPPTTAGHSSPLQQSAFPDLSSSTSTKRNRRSPWPNHDHTPINPYPPRLQELNNRALARDDHNAIQRSKKGLFGLEDLDKLALGDSTDVQAQEVPMGPAQVYGLSRVTVKDFSQSNGKGKNKAKREVHYGQGGPDIYNRHNTPWVQKGRRIAVQAEDMTGGRTLGQAADWPDDDEAGRDAEGPNLTQSDHLALPEVIAICERAARVAAAESRGDPSTSTRSDPWELLHLKLARDLSSPAKMLRASWLAPSSKEPALWDRLRSLPTEIEESCLEVISTSICRTTRNLSHRLHQSQPTTSDFEGMSRLLWLCIHLDFHRSYTNAYDAYQAVLKVFCGCSDHDEDGTDLVKALASTRQLPMLVKGVVASLNLTLEQARLAGDVLTHQDLSPAAQVLRYLRTATDLELAVEDPVSFRTPELAQPLPDHQSQPYLQILRTEAEYAFLHPLFLKLSNLSSLVQQSMEVARKHSLWSTFYSPRATPSSSSYDQALLLIVCRKEVVPSTLTAFASLQSWEILRDLRIEFQGEEGVDSYSGGVKKEWFAQVSKGLCRQGIVRPVGEGEEQDSSARYVTLNGDFQEDPSDAVLLLGKMIALSIYHQIPLGMRFPDYLLRFLFQGNVSSSPEQDLADLEQLFPRLVRSLRQILAWKPPIELDATAAAALFESTFHLNWTATATASSASSTGGTINPLHPRRAAEPIPLVRGGANRPVTLANRQDFVECLAQWHLYDSIEWALDLLRQGFQSIFPDPSAGRSSSSQDDPISKASRYLSHFDPSEWALLVAGPEEIVTTQLLKSYTAIFNRRSSTPGRAEDEAMLSWFWSALLMDGDDEVDVGWLLSYVTASPFLPPSYHSDTDDGSSLTSAFTRPRRPLFTIHLLDADPLSQLLEKPLPLPFSSTCTSTLFLPRYRSEEECREKVRVLKELVVGSSIEQVGGSDGGVGFGLK